MATQTVTDLEWAHNAQMEEYRRALYAGAAIPAAEQEPEEDVRVRNLFATQTREQAPVRSAAEERIAAYRAYAATLTEPNFFEDTYYRDGALVGEVPAAPAPQETAPVASAPAVEPQPEENEDSLPTPRTMSVIASREQEQNSVGMQQGFFASLSTRMKIVLASVITAIVLAVVFVCINTAIINSMKADVAAREQTVSELAAQSEAIQAEIERQISFENIAAWAEENGMVPNAR